MDTMWMTLKFFLWGWVVVLIGALIWYLWFRVTDYKRARTEIFAYVDAYKRKCSGANRFIVTVEALQDAFREYDTPTINKVWLELVKERVIERDSDDNEWCLK